MRYPSIIILILCILLPPLLYVASVQRIESYLTAEYLSDVQKIYLGDTKALLAGTVDIKDEINENINQYLKSVRLLSWGVTLSLTVTADNGRILYPMVYGENDVALHSANPIQVAAKNYNLLSQGLTIQADVELRHNSLPANSIICFYVMVFFLFSFFYFRRTNRSIKERDAHTAIRLKELIDKENEYKNHLQELKKQKGRLGRELTELKTKFEAHKQETDSNEEEMLKEILDLEEIINKNIELQNRREEETDRLKREIAHYTQNRVPRDVKSEKKRLESVYKNLIINDRAIKGFTALADDLRIKSEKIIHDLNDKPDLVSVKRKVFSGKNGKSVLETIFGHKGRIYYRYGNGNKIEVLTIGTKNSQTKDMEFLRNL